MCVAYQTKKNYVGNASAYKYCAMSSLIANACFAQWTTEPKDKAIKAL